MDNLIVWKLLTAVLLAVASLAGLLSTLCCVKPCSTRVGRSSHSHRCPFSHQRTLSLANSFAAGMLIATAFCHFFRHAMEGAVKGVVSPLWISIAMLAGMAIPVAIECCIVDSAKGSRYHSFVDSNLSDDEPQPGRSERPSLPRDGRGRHCTTFFLLLALMYIHAATEGAVVALGDSISALTASAIPLLAHRSLDGVAIGASIAKRLFHFEDECERGYFYADRCTESEPLNSNNRPVSLEGKFELPLSNSENRAIFFGDVSEALRRELCQWPVLLWLAVTPLSTLIFIALSTGFVDVAADGNRYEERYESHAKGSMCVANSTKSHFIQEGCRGGLRATSRVGEWGAFSLNVLAPVADGLGGGFFLFVGFMMVFREEQRGVMTSLAVCLGVAAALLLATAQSNH
ncbi:hypothetical protein TRVL_00297 [Trypanosoma vivax]|uniref:Uncharacterized protein n=1 Tax=Trypanosoma vivax (strain Y486) TaxID=1055687 RepID=G0TW38_TRYVY|nr:hypothetical protein TRVL_00297 [Trypanosoma vivax]CCC48154.1 conserved hypothetical protein [Trypanosoma vivax Y486]